MSSWDAAQMHMGSVLILHGFELREMDMAMVGSMRSLSWLPMGEEAKHWVLCLSLYRTIGADTVL